MLRSGNIEDVWSGFGTGKCTERGSPVCVRTVNVICIAGLVISYLCLI